MARSFIKRMDTANRPTVNEFLMKVLRVCRRHAIEGLKKAVKPHVDEDQWKRFEGFVSLKTPQDVQEFSDWVFSLNIATISAWWNHKLNHKWILLGLLECLSGLSHEDWLTTPFTSNGNETQHHWTNSQTGIGLNARECILRAAKADRAVGEQFKASLESGVMTNSRNELSHRTARNTKRHTSAIQKAQQAHTGQKKIAELRAQLAIAVAEAKTSSSGVVRVTQRSKTKSLVASAHIKGSASTRPKRPEKSAVIQDELEGIEMMTAPEVGSLDGEGNPNLPDLAEPVSEAANIEDWPPPLSNNTLSPLSESVHLPTPELDTALPRQSPPQPPSSPRRSSRKRKISITDEDAPAKNAKISGSPGF
ncbi:hypothetical protein B0H10DRAFT_2445675 [Mycena sp. CBHHK59/15]|nr:hypothetical protein B0H10DRAFT_2445675 [Mycena sp. CBHHK59/15]